MTSKEAPRPLHDHGNRILIAGFALAILYFGRSVLIPLALALMLSLLVAPLVRALRRVRIGRVASVFLAMAALAVSGMAVTAAIGMQVLRTAESLPQYESNIHHKLRTLEKVTVGPLMRLTDEARHLAAISELAGARPGTLRDLDRFVQAAPGRGRTSTNGFRGPSTSIEEIETPLLNNQWLMFTIMIMVNLGKGQNLQDLLLLCDPSAPE